MKTLKQALSISMSAALALTSMPWTASAAGPMEAGMPAFVKTFTPAEQIGYVASSYSPSADIQRPRLIMITNLHGHMEVGHHILSILDKIVPEIKRTNKDQNQKVPLFVEGGWEKNLEEPLKTVANPDARKFMAEYFMEKSEMGPLQTYSEQVAGSNMVTLTGVENKDEYLANKARFAKSYPERKALLTAILRQEEAIKVLTDHLTNGSYQYVQAMRDSYNAGRISSDRYAKGLLKQASRFNITGSAVETLKRASTVNASDLDLALTSVYRDVLSQLAQSKPLTAFLRQSINKEDTVRHNLAKIDGDLDLLKRLIGDQLTPNEVTVALGRMPQLIQVAQLLVSKQQTGIDVTKVIQDSFDFYPFALLRDDSLAANSVANLNAMGPDATGVLVVGGFHADAIGDYLRSHQIPYMTINPTMSRDLTTEEQLNYIKRICDDHVTPKEFQQDLTWLQNSPHKVSQSAIGAESDLDTKTDSTQKDLLNSYAATVAPLLAAKDTVGLRKLMESLSLQPGQDQQLAQTASTVSKVAQENIVAQAATVKGVNGQFDINLGLPSLEFVRQGNSFVSTTGDTSATALNALELLNREARDSNSAFSLKTVTIQAVNDEHIVTTTHSEAFVVGDNSEHPVIFVANSRFEQLGSAQGRAVHTFAHEISHVVNPNASETMTTVRGVVAGSLFAAEHTAEGGIASFVQAIAPQFTAAGLSVEPKTLTQRIANLINPSDLHSASVQKISEELAKEFPEVSEYARNQVLNDVESGLAARAGLTTEKGTLERAREKMRQLRMGIVAAGRAA